MAHGARRRRGWVGLGFAVWLLAAAAHGAEVRDPYSTFRVTIDAPGARVCVAHPAAERDPVACEGVPGVPASVANQPADPNALRDVAIVHLVYPDWRFFLAVIANPTRDNHELTDGEANALVDGTRRGMAESLAGRGRLVPTATVGQHETRRVHGVQVLRYVAVLEPVPGSRLPLPERILVYQFLGAGSIVTVNFYTSRENLDRVVPLADAIIATATMQPAPPARSLWGRLGYVLGAVGGVVLLAWLLMRATRTKPPQRPGGFPGAPGAPGPGWPPR